MFEKFTDHARKVMGLANQEARRFSHEDIGTEHILIGLVKDTDCKAAVLLQDFQIDLRMVRIELEKRIKPGPNMFVMGKLPQTPDAKSLVLKSIQAARTREDGLVGTLHLLFAMLSLPDTVACGTLRALCDLPTLLAAVTNRMDALRTSSDKTTASSNPLAAPAPHPTSREYLVFLGAAQLAARHPAPLTPEQIDQCLNDAIAILDRLVERRTSE